MDTTITISSTLSSVGKSVRKTNIPQSESSIVRVPVSWDSPLKPCDRKSSCTPSTLQKVNNWINSLNRLGRDNVDSNSYRQSSDFSDFDMHNGLNVEGDLVSSKIMSDYSKSELKGQRTEDEFDNYCRSPYDFENDKGSTSKIHEDIMYGGGPKQHFHPKAVKRRKSLQNYDLEERDDKSDEIDSDEPLSPESEKKKELCSYLQLMKPTDKKTVMILQNRRSVRVKNLSIMQEKRELERKLKKANTDVWTNEIGHSDNTGIEQKYPGLKSFEEMNVDLDKKKYQWLKYTGARSSNDSFCFPKPSDDLKEIVNDFDDSKICWFEKIKEESCKRQYAISKKIKERKECDKKNGDKISQNNKQKNKVEATKPINTVSQYIQFKKKKSEAAKNEYKTTPTNGEIKEKEAKEYKIIEGNKSKIKIINYNKNGNYSGSKRRKEENNKAYNGPQSIDAPTFEKTKLHTLNCSNEARFLIPKPSIHLVHDVNDFDIIIKQDEDLIKNNSSPPPGIKVENKTKSKLPQTSETVSPPTTNNENPTVKGEILKTFKTKVNSLKKRNKAKKLYAERNIRRSSFKIKLKPKRKSLGSQTKSDKKFTSTKSPLISDIMRSLRNRNIETPTSEIGLLKYKKTKKKEDIMNKKENRKRTIQKSKNQEGNIKPKHSENDMKTVLKEPLKDKNKNPIKGSILGGTKSPVAEINYRMIVAISKLPEVNDEISPKNNNLQDVMSDIDFCNLSNEHKTSLLVKNTSQRDIPSHVPIIAIYHKNSNGSDSISKEKPKEKSEFYSQILNIEKCPDENIADALNNPSPLLDSRTENDSELHSFTRIDKGCVTPISSREKSDTNSGKIPNTLNETPPFITFKKDAGVKALHKCLNIPTPKSVASHLEKSPASWSSESPSHKRKRNEHSIKIFKEHGPVLKAFYLEYNLVLCQEFMVSFWNQSPLGNVLGSQTMWFDIGSVQRIAMNNKCIFKESLDMVVYTVNTVAYIELWIKEHQSDIREGPVADVFATVYFWKKGQNGLDKKVLQLENINGFADDVQYSVFKSSPKIVVSWHLACSELESKKTYIHCYQLAADYQTVCNITEYEAVEHYVSSLHNIEGCDSFIMGCGENKITLWNIDSGYVVATIEMSEIKSPLSTLWVKCDRGFIFTLQQCVDRELRLIAIHAINYTWKKLASYVPPDEYDRLKGVCVENGIVLGFYDQGILCWNAEKAEAVLEESHNDAEFISGKYVISVISDKVILKHAITHLISACSC